jgi:dethiobiotin synthetase
VRRLFVTATDTGVGKTSVARALLAAYRARGHVVAAMKPCETGGGDDAARLAAATGRALDPALVNPYRFARPAAPSVAARAEGAYVELRQIAAAADALSVGADLLIVEGAGGLLVPLDGQHTMADLARVLRLPVLIVARPSLGTVNHTLLTVEAARRRDLALAGFVFSRTDAPRGADEPTNAAAIARQGGVRYLGTLPRVSGGDGGDDAERHLALGALWDAL